MAHAPTRYDRHIFSRYLIEGEHIIIVIHRHWIIVVVPILESTLLGILLPILGLIAFQSPWWLLMAFIIWIISGILITHHIVNDWFCDAFILTDRGLVRVDWKNILSVESERIDYTSIDTVEYEKSGFFATLFSFGKLLVVTANSTHSLDTIHHPQAARDTLSKARDDARTSMYGSRGDSGSTGDVEVLRQALRSLIAERGGDAPEHRLDPKTPRKSEPPRMNDVSPPPA